MMLKQWYLKKNKLLFIFFINLNFYSLFSNLPEFQSACNCKLTENLKKLKTVYEKNMLLTNEDRPIIPLKIHQIWIGPNPLPEKFKWMCETWKKFHPHWQYKLWTNEDLKNFKMINKEAFDKSTNWGQKSDILRYEILDREGGIYVDIDFECLKNFEFLNYRYSFFAGIVPETDCINNALIGTVPNHPIIKNCIKKIQAKKEFSSEYYKIMYDTGPYLLSEIILDYIKNSTDLKKIIFLPSDCFYPLPAYLRFKFWNNEMTFNELLFYKKPISFAIHYWATSWQTKGINRLNNTYYEDK